jgi:hypothetical protein
MFFGVINEINTVVLFQPVIKTSTGQITAQIGEYLLEELYIE